MVTNWHNQRNQLRAQWVSHEKNHRQILYRDFIDEASKCYIDALQHDKADVAGLVGLYAKFSRMRMLSSDTVVASAEQITRRIVDTYLEPQKDFVELRDMVNNGTIDLLRDSARLAGGIRTSSRRGALAIVRADFAPIQGVTQRCTPCS
ncbi:hypothetical protein V1283_005085 [Bradyrhizobium sp. AZCC 2262]|uniref:hypothetical protein n=1 Tax=Bradyrhizobium sp. AZCC 2262 TaxID=3117022 RepID=UPI002FF270C7